MSKRIDLMGEVFGDLKVIEFHSVINTHATWLVKCLNCGELSVVASGNLISHNSTQCNTCRLKALADKNTIHGLCNDKLYGRWNNLKTKDMLCDEWTEFTVFHNDVAQSYIEPCSLRRIDRSLKHSKENSYWCMPRVNVNIRSTRIYFV